MGLADLQDASRSVHGRSELWLGPLQCSKQDFGPKRWPRIETVMSDVSLILSAMFDPSRNVYEFKDVMF